MVLIYFSVTDEAHLKNHCILIEIMIFLNKFLIVLITPSAIEGPLSIIFA